MAKKVAIESNITIGSQGPHLWARNVRNVALFSIRVAWLEVRLMLSYLKLLHGPLFCLFKFHLYPKNDFFLDSSNPNSKTWLRDQFKLFDIHIEMAMAIAAAE